ncbi:protein kinase domain-containing protein [Malaciobacter marinus]|jgi:serine/threonine protein kinase|uniref:Non-specific serine/threonine protein kinase/serine/threonine-protein kinase/serine/threonine-protein kinase Stk1 n=1 Tax=Malaciobacter marinus TaxID=505249 RepID=A0AB36ZXE1_9BACT|nr:protein kinase [Malaciobacter marinus]PPK61325.1 non-specific serine/threonine protein kinase/serine/threonine-protein kinase/serine/threonine-protein kinase Stk1 [Malaciobacter marinus]SKB66540.1 non-specific serine/threonine protein kinase/serine/threonine protein kinase/serine/threonine-protein kinase Stk1 [Malaciobacter marinus]
MNTLLKNIKKTSKKQNSQVKKIFNKRYVLKDKIAQGGLCDVFLVEDIYDLHFNTDSNIVIKLPNEITIKNKDISSLLFSEYKFLRELNHPNIVKVYDFGIDKKTNIPYLILEYIEGKLLNDISIFDMNKDLKLDIFKTLLNTVKYIHSKNIIHADINPSNIIIDNNNNITLIDFGISLSCNSNSIHLDYNKVKAYNPKYSAPEIINGEIPTEKSDIYSIASIVFELFTFTRPVIKDNKMILDNSNTIPFYLKKWLNRNLSINSSARTINFNKYYNFFVNFLHFN